MPLEIAGDAVGNVVMGERVEHPAFLRDDQVVVRREVIAILRIERGALVHAGRIEGDPERRHGAEPRRRIGGVERGVRLRRARQRDARQARERNVAAAGGEEEARDAAGAAAGLARRHGQPRAAPERRRRVCSDAAIAQRLSGEAAALAAGDAAAGGIVQRDDDIAAILREIAAGGDGEALVERLRRTVETDLRTSFDAFEIVTHDEVDDASDRVRAIDRRRAASDDLGPGDQRRRNSVEVGGLLGAGDGEAASVDQHQVAGGTEAAQVHVGRAAGNGVGGRAAIGRSDELWLFAQQPLDVDGAGQLDVFGIDHRHRSGGVKPVAGNARAGNDDRSFVPGSRLPVLGARCRRDAEHQDRDAGLTQQPDAPAWEIPPHHTSPSGYLLFYWRPSEPCLWHRRSDSRLSGRRLLIHGTGSYPIY